MPHLSTLRAPRSRTARASAARAAAASRATGHQPARRCGAAQATLAAAATVEAVAERRRRAAAPRRRSAAPLRGRPLPVPRAAGGGDASPPRRDAPRRSAPRARPRAAAPAPRRGRASACDRRPSRSRTSIGRTLNHRYVVEDKIGEGGFGAVFRGKQIATGREVALKILHPHNVGDQTIVARFRREAEACSKLRDSAHRHHLRLRRDRRTASSTWRWSCCAGAACTSCRRPRGRSRASGCCSILDQVAESLGEAHQNGIVHRDMKPENVIVETRDGEDYVKVLDFGIAKMISDERRGPGADRGRPDAGHAGVHVARAAARAEARRPLRHLRARHDGVRDADRRAAVHERPRRPIDIINFHMKHEPPPPSKLRPTR